MIKKIFKAIVKPLTGFINVALKGLSKFFTKTIGSAFSTALGFLTKMLKTMTGGILDFLFFIVEGVMFFFFVITCGLKLIGNFYKCAIFYVLDIFIWLILFFPLLIVSIVFSFQNKSVKGMLERVADCIKWPNSIQNMCYRCKNRGSDKKFDFWDKLKEALQGKETSWNFFYFFTISVIGIGACYTLFTLIQNSAGFHIKKDGPIVFSILTIIALFVILIIVLTSIAIARGNLDFVPEDAKNSASKNSEFLPDDMEKPQSKDIININNTL